MIKEGSRVRVISDSFQFDPHGVAIGTELTVVRVNDILKYDDFPDVVKLHFMLEGNQPFDLPRRAHVEVLGGYANIPLEDLELVTVQTGDTVRILEDDEAGGFYAGETFTVLAVDDFEAITFLDNDGDERYITSDFYEKVY